MNFANKLTLLRILLVPVFIASLYLPQIFPATITWYRWLAALIFLFAALTDIFDGKYARKHHLVTDFGKLMDPIADKLLTVSALIMLIVLEDGTEHALLHPIEAIVLIAREFIISGFRLIAASKGVVIAAGKLGKLKTTCMDIGIVALLLYEQFPFRYLNPALDIIVHIFMYLTLALSVVSCIEYIVKNKEVINFHDC